jgi:hypothetical protein
MEVSTVKINWGRDQERLDWDQVATIEINWGPDQERLEWDQVSTVKINWGRDQERLDWDQVSTVDTFLTASDLGPTCLYYSQHVDAVLKLSMYFLT